MQMHEKTQFIEKELVGLWPDWKPTEAETRVWLGVLTNYDYNTARTAIQQVFSDAGGNYRRPKPNGFIGKVKLLAHKQSTGKPKHELPDATVWIHCIEPPARNLNRSDHLIPVYPEDMSRIGDVDYVRACAHGMAARFTELYGGVWSVVVRKKHEPSGLIGEEAREAAFSDILSGPDTKTKRWLRQYLERKTAARTEKKGPVHISEAVAGYHDDL